MKIGLITTLNTNIGDDFIREGICLLLKEAFRGRDLEFIPVNKHHPYTAYPASHPVRLAGAVSRMPVAGRFLGRPAERLGSLLGQSVFDKCDMIVQCGAPVIWPNCHASEWANPLWHDIVGRLHKRIPVLNLAAGSCYPWENQPDSITDPGDADYIRAIAGYCRLTTSRDSLARKLFKSVGAETPLIPCSAFLASGAVKGDPKGLVLINYMSGGGHYDWGQGVERSEWELTVRRLVEKTRRRHKVAFLCHDDREFEWAGELAPDLPRLFPKTPGEYFSVTSEATAAICNRMHASVGMAGMGVPSIAVGTDTRLLMVRSLGLKSVYVKDASFEVLEQAFEEMLSDCSRERQRLMSLKSETWERYLMAIKGAL